MFLDLWCFQFLFSILWSVVYIPLQRLVLIIYLGRRSQDGGGIGGEITFSSTNSSKEQQYGEQSLQSNF